MLERQSQQTDVAQPDAQKAAPAPRTGPGAGLLDLQSRAGNRATAALTLQASLEVGAADSAFEREADAVAAEVVRRLGRRHSTGDGERSAQGPALADRLQRIARRAAPSGPDPVGPEGGSLDEITTRAVEQARGGGAPLESGPQRDMESAFGADFSAVRIHRGPDADLLNRQLGARAFTIGSDIFFRGGEPSLTSEGGRHLLAHELTHTLQQGASAARTVQRAAGGEGEPGTEVEAG